MWKIGSEAFKYATFDLDIGRNSELSSRLSQANVLALSYKSITFEYIVAIITYLTSIPKDVYLIRFAQLRIYAWNVYDWS